MISRYALYDTAELTDYFALAEGLPKGVKPHYNYSPTVLAPVIVATESGRTLKLMKWGLIANGAKDTNSVFRYKTYNIATESMFTRHSWERLVREHRCLIPANGFYELNGSGKKRAFYIQPKDASMLAFAGVYSSWQDTEGTVHGTYSMLTTTADQAGEDRRTRMPMVIKRDDYDRWLDSSVTDASSIYDMLRPCPAGILTDYEVSPAVHSPKPDHAGLIERL